MLNEIWLIWKLHRQVSKFIDKYDGIMTPYEQNNGIFYKPSKSLKICSNACSKVLVQCTQSMHTLITQWKKCDNLFDKISWTWKYSSYEMIFRCLQISWRLNHLFFFQLSQLLYSLLIYVRMCVCGEVFFFQRYASVQSIM